MLVVSRCGGGPSFALLFPREVCPSGPYTKNVIVRPTLASAFVGFAWHSFLGSHVTEVLPVPSCALGEHWHCRTPHIILGFL